MFAVIAPALMTGAFADRELWTVYGVHRALGALGIFSSLPLVGAADGWRNEAFGISRVGLSST